MLGLGGDPLDRGAAEPAHEIEVVRCQVLDDADVADAVGERPDALGGDQEDLAELAFAHAPAQLQQRRVEALDVPDRGTHAGAVAQLAQLARLVGRVAASGFSTRTATPAGASSATAARCSSVGTATTAKSIGPDGEQLAGRGEQRRRVAQHGEAVAAGVNGARERDAGLACSRRA